MCLLHKPLHGEPKACKGIYVGFEARNCSHKVFLPPREGYQGHLVESTHVQFDETTVPGQIMAGQVGMTVCKVKVNLG